MSIYVYIYITKSVSIYRSIPQLIYLTIICQSSIMCVYMKKPC